MSKLTVLLSSFVVAVVLLSGRTEAAVVEVDVTIKAVNPQARGITVVYKTDLGEKTIELDVSRKAEITLNGNSDSLASLGPGLKAKVSYDKELGRRYEDRGDRNSGRRQTAGVGGTFGTQRRDERMTMLGFRRTG